MTENEAINKLDSLHYKIRHDSFCNKVYNTELKAFEEARTALEEIQKYRAIGTVEECREAIEKQKPIKPDVWGDVHSDGIMVLDMRDCPNCWTTYEIDYDKHKYCPECG